MADEGYDYDDEEGEEEGDEYGAEDVDIDLDALGRILAGMSDEEVLTQFTTANETLRDLEQLANAELAPLNTQKLQLAQVLIEFMLASSLDAIELLPPEARKRKTGTGTGTTRTGTQTQPDGADQSSKTKKAASTASKRKRAGAGAGAGTGAGAEAESPEAPEAPEGTWYLRLGQTVITASKPSAKLFLEVLSGLTPEVFREKVVELEDDREERLAKWNAKQREEAMKKLRAMKREWTKSQKDKLTVPYSMKKPARTSAARAMADTAALLGGNAASNVDIILKAGRKRSAFVGDVSSGAGAGGGAGSGGGGSGTVPDPTDEAQIAALMEPPPSRATERFRSGKGGTKNPMRPQLPLAGKLTKRQLLAEVLYVLIVEKSKGRRWKVEVRTQKGRPKALLEGDRVPTEVAVQCEALRQAREEFSAVAAAWRRKKAVQNTMMRMCEDRVRRYLEAIDPEEKRSKRILSCGDKGTRTVTIASVEEPKVSKSLTMWDVSTLVDAAVELAARTLPALHMDSVFDLSAGGAAAAAARLIDERVTSTLITSMLQGTKEIEASRTTTVQRVKVIRAGVVAAPSAK
jgi:hypothetical protein